MRTIKADLLADVVSSYDQTKTTIQGRVASKTIDSETVLGPPLSKFIDVATDTGGQTPIAMFASDNNRLFVCTSVTATAAVIHLYDFTPATGAHAYVGQIRFALPNSAATTHTLRGLRVYNDAGNTGWKIVIATSGSVLINGGVFIINSVDKTDFQPVPPPLIPFATGNDQKAVYFTQLSSAIGVNHAESAIAGVVMDSAAGRLYSHNGISATHQYYVRDLTASLTYSNQAVNVTVASPGKVQLTAHGFAANDPVVFNAGTLPTGLTVGTIYFVRNPTANDFEVSATSGGASINTTGSPAVGAFLGRAWGTTSAGVLHRTGNLPALSGTLLLLNSERNAIPVSAPLNGGVLNGNSCAFFMTSTNMYLGLLSELTNGATSWPSLTTSNILGSTNQITAPTATLANWSNALNQGMYITNTSKLVLKQVENNNIKALVGELNNQYYEATALDTINLGFVSVVDISSMNGWVFILGATAGQRGIGCFDMRSDATHDYSYIVTKVLDTSASQMRAVDAFEKLYDLTGNILVQYRTSGFGSISGGWTDLPSGEDLEAVATASQIQYKILFKMQCEGSSSPAQLYELLASFDSNNEVSDNWEYSYDASASGSPTRAGFRLKKAYSSSVPTLYFRAYDLADSLLINHNTSANAAQFEYSTDDGSSWLPLGTIPNTVGTLIRYTFTSPPGVKIRPSVRES